MKPLSLKTAAALCAGVSVFSVAAVAIAQDAPGRGPQGRPGPAAAERGDHRQGPGRFDPAQRKQRLHDLLQITPAQEGAFNAWQASMKPPERPQRPDRQAAEKLTTPQRLDARLAMMDKRMGEMRSRADATKRFYGQLTATQRAAFDAMPRIGGHRGGHGGRGHGFGHGPGRGGPGVGGDHRGPGGQGNDRGGHDRGGPDRP